MYETRCALFATVTASLVLVVMFSFPAPADATPTWAPAATGPIRPGVMTYTAGAQCTANFVFTDGAGAVYNGVSYLARTLAYAGAHGGPKVNLAAGTQPFRGTGGILGILG